MARGHASEMQDSLARPSQGEQGHGLEAHMSALHSGSFKNPFGINTFPLP